VARDRSRGVVGIFVLVLILFVIFMFFAFFTVMSLKKSGVAESDGFSTSKSKPIGVVTVKGVIMDSKETVKLLQKAEKKKSIKAIIVRIESPGGAVAPTQEIYEEMRRIDKDKPVYASFGSVAASGGYYLGAGARKIYSNAGTITGSIGVIMNFANLKKLYEWVRVKPDLVKAGKFKDIGSSSRDMKPEERMMLNEMVNGVHDQFIADIEATRKKKIKGNLRDHAQGQIFSGTQALKLGLVDEIAGLYKAARKIHKELKISDEFGIKFIKKKEKFKLKKFLTTLTDIVNKFTAKVDSDGAPMFLYQPSTL
jgi:protease-4